MKKIIISLSFLLISFLIWGVLNSKNVFATHDCGCPGSGHGCRCGVSCGEWCSACGCTTCGFDCGDPCDPEDWGGCSASCGPGTQTNACGDTRDCNNGPCCDANEGNTCNSAPNNCGDTNNGTIQCNGTCSASAPPDGIITCRLNLGCNDNNACTADVCNNPRTCSSSCTNTNTPVNGTWGAPYGACSTTCGWGIQTMTCNGASCGGTCLGSNTRACIVNNPDIWTGWGACIPSCGFGTQTRTNQCGTVDSRPCTNGVCIPSWFQSVGGDVYGNGVNSSVSTTPPLGFKGFLATNASSYGNVFSKGSVDAGSDLRISESKVYVKNIEANGISGLWPQGGFTPPSTAVSISSCSNLFTDGNLDPGKTYKGDSYCIQTALNSLGTAKYKLSTNGVVVIYVTGNTSIKFSNSFNSQSSNNKRIILVSNPKIVIGKELGFVSPDKTKPDIESVLISNTEINFESGANPESGVYDTSVVIDGSVISPSIKMLRNVGQSSNYPSEVIVYNAYYLTQLLQQEKDLGYTNYTGLMVQEGSWGNSQ